MGRGANRALAELSRPMRGFGILKGDWPAPDQWALEAEALALGSPDWRPKTGLYPDPSAFTEEEVTALDLPPSERPRPQGAQVWPATPTPPQPAPFRGYIPGHRLPPVAPRPPASRWWINVLLLIVSLWALFGVVGAAVGVMAARLFG